jgi:hypothetical protein
MPKPCLVTAILVLISLKAHGFDEIPKGFSEDRYTKVWERNPFAWAVAPPTLGPRYYEKLVLTSWLDDQGRKIIFVSNKETKESFRITSEPNAQSLRLVSIRTHRDPKKVEAYISNGKEEGMVRFDTKPVVLANANPGLNNQASPNGGPVQQPRRDGLQPVPPDLDQPPGVQQPQPPNGAVRPNEVARRRISAQSMPQHQPQINPAYQHNGRQERGN